MYFFLLSADELSKVRLQLIAGVSEAVLKDLIDGFKPSGTHHQPDSAGQPGGLEDRVGQLVAMMCNKGDVASVLMISILEQKDKHLTDKLRFRKETNEVGETCESNRLKNP